jgi:hypothetical protein
MVYYIDKVHGIKHCVGARVRLETVVTDISHSGYSSAILYRYRVSPVVLGARVRQETVVTDIRHSSLFFNCII